MIHPLAEIPRTPELRCVKFGSGSMGERDGGSSGLVRGRASYRPEIRRLFQPVARLMNQKRSGCGRILRNFIDQVKRRGKVVSKPPDLSAAAMRPAARSTGISPGMVNL